MAKTTNPSVDKRQAPIKPAMPLDNISDVDSDSMPVCVMTFNASDPSGAGGLTADITAMTSAGAHPLAVVTGAYVRDSSEIIEHYAFDEEAVTEQARVALEDMTAGAIKVGFVGSPENISAIAEIASDYAELPLVAYMPSLSWWQEDKIDDYLDAYRELLLPQATLLIGNHSTLWRWLLPEWPSDRSPSAKDIAKAAAEYGVPYTLVTGIPMPDQFIDNVLAAPQSILYSEKFERFEAVFTGAGETLSAALTALLANGHDLQAATSEALTYLDQSLDAGFHPGMGHILPDRLFWAQADEEDVAADKDAPEESAALSNPAALAVPAIIGNMLDIDPTKPFFDLPPNGTTKH
jgi:hydroxymethylpyrimidine/phosphomethylpyrimidine kinase